MPTDASPDLGTLTLCPLAKRIAQPKRGGGSLRQQTEAHLQHKAYVNVVNLLHHFPEERVAAETFLRDSIQEKQRALALGTGCFEHVSTMGKVEGSWMISWIAEKTLLTSDLLQKALIWDSKAVSYIFCHMLHSLPSAKLPSECSQKQFFYFVCDFLWATLGNHTFKDINRENNSTIIAQDGQVDWGQFAYKLVFDDTAGRVTKVVHRRTGASADIDGEAPITGTFNLKDGWSDSQAVASNGKASHFPLHEFFGAKVGPHSAVEFKGATKEFVGALKFAKEKMSELEVKVATGVLGQSDELVQAAAGEKQSLRTEKAREMLKARKEEAFKRRRVSVLPSPSA
jgi:hypothetical protein